LLHNGAAQFDGENMDSPLIGSPEVKRLLTTKQWSTVQETDAARYALSVRLYAATMARGFVRCLAMYNFLRVLYDDHNLAPESGLPWRTGKPPLDTELRKLYISRYGETPAAGTTRLWTEFESQGFPEFEGPANPKLWRRFLVTVAGPATPLELSGLEGLVTGKVHGKDVAVHLPRSWLE